MNAVDPEWPPGLAPEPAPPPTSADAEAGWRAFVRRRLARGLEPWLDLRDRCLSNRRFQRAAAAFPLTRPIARRNARATFDLVAGFVYSQVLVACVRLRLFDALAEGPQSASALAQRLGLSDAAALRLLAAAAALQLVQLRSGGRYGLGKLGAPLVGNAAVLAMVEHHAALYADLADPVALLRSSGGASRHTRGSGAAAPAAADHAAVRWRGGMIGRPTDGVTDRLTDGGVADGGMADGGMADDGITEDGVANAVEARASGAGALARYWPYAGAALPADLAPDRVAEYSALMSASQPLVADEVLDAYSLRRHRCLLDVGGGEGGFLISAARRAPHLRLMLFDLPAVAERARARFTAAGLQDRAVCVGGSFHDAALPAGADIASLIRVIHDHDDDAALALLRAVREALPPGGALLLAEPMAGTPGAEPMGDAYFGFYLLAMGRGRPRTVEELSRMLHAAGFVTVRALRSAMPLQTRVLLARTAPT